MTEDKEDIYALAFQLIGIAGDSKHESMQGIRQARDGDFVAARASLQAADRTMVAAHNLQTDMLRLEAEGKPVPVNIIMVHAQDHLTTAQIMRDMAEEFIKLREDFAALKKDLAAES